MIVIAGDSWGSGVWEESGILTHGGFAQLVHELGHDVINLSQAGNSNQQNLVFLSQLMTYKNLGGYPYNYTIMGSRLTPWSVTDVKRIFIFQTSWTRDYGGHLRYMGPDVIPQPHYVLPAINIEHFDQKVIQKWYARLGNFSQRYGIPISIIGGGVDTEYFGDFEKAYPGVTIACQSVTNLLIEGDARVSQPVRGMRFDAEFIEEFKNKSSHMEFVAQLMDEIERADARETLWRQNPQWFWPDGRHPNFSGHEKLFGHIQAQGLL